MKMTKRPNALAKAIKKPDQKTAPPPNEEPVAAAPTKNVLAPKTPQVAVAAPPPVAKPVAPVAPVPVAATIPPVSPVGVCESRNNRRHL